MNLDIMREISYNLLPYKLSLSIELNNIYDENWFKNKLLSKYPDCKKNKNLWKELYKKSLKSGYIYMYVNDVGEKIINIEGIKVSSMNNNLLILTFYGDLYVFNDENLQTELIDIDVNDIDGNSYIKGNKFYCINDNKNSIQLITEADTDFISVLKVGSYCYCAITKDKFYYLMQQMSQELKIIDCPNASKLIYSSSIILQLENKEIKVFNSRKYIFDKLEIENIDEIYPGIAKMSDGTLISFLCHFVKNDLVSCTKLINTNMKRLTGSFQSIYTIVLIDGCIYKLEKSELKYITNNIKNIYDGNLVIK